MDSKQSPFEGFGQSGERYAILSAIYVEGGLAFLALAIGYFVGFSPAETLKWDIFSLAVAVGATIPLLALFVVLNRSAFVPLRRVRVLVRSFVHFFFQNCTPLQIGLICTLAGIGEELLYRGLIQEGISQMIGGTWGAVFGIGIASLFFGITHWITKTYVILAAIMGIYLGLLLHFSDNILVPIITHGLYDYYVIRFVLDRSRNVPHES